jgi:multidrug efflux pump
MAFTDLYIKRPVLATVISLMILALGLRALGMLPILQYPFTENAVITISTVYTGASPDVVAGFITTPLENSLSQVNGIDYMTSSSVQNASTILINLKLNYDPNKALADINTKVSAVLNQLPPGSLQPVITVAIGETIDSMYIGYYSNVLQGNQITDYLLRVVQPQLQALDGIQVAEILGGRLFALRASLLPEKLAGYGLTAADVANALAVNDFISAVGRTDGQMFTLNLTASTGLSTVEEFRNLIVKSESNSIIRLGDVADVFMGSSSYDSSVKFDGQAAVYIGIQIAPAANLLSVIQSVRDTLPNIEKQLPQGLHSKIVYDATQYVNSSIHEVERSLFEALAIVTVVIFLFLGSIRSVIIPLVAIPLSLIGTFFIMLVLGYSVNLLTLLALVLGIGLVVDDAIIIVENIHRHIELGESPLQAALQGTRELASPIIAMTIVLIAVFAPIGFMGGLTGALFSEFAFTLAGAVFVSAVIALTLSPMMCSKFLKSDAKAQTSKFASYVDNLFEKIDRNYQRILRNSLNFLPVSGVFAVIILTSIYFLYASSQSELAPQEDQGIILSSLTGSPNATLYQTELYSDQVTKVFSTFSETSHTFQIDGASGLNTSIGGLVLKPWDERTSTSNQLQPKVQKLLNDVTGAKIAVFQPPSLPGGGSGLPVQFVIQTTNSFEELNLVMQALLSKATASGMFLYLDTDLKVDKAQTNIEFNRDKASELGLTMQTLGNILGSALSNGYINYFNLAGRSYQVIPQVKRVDRQNNNQLLQYYITTANGTAVPLSTVAHTHTTVVPESLNHFQQLNSATLLGVPAFTVPLGDALHTLKEFAQDILPDGYTINYGSQSRQYVQESSSLVVTFFFALIIIFLSLAALFESFRDPFIVLISVPMSICGALIFISLGIGGATLNIYSEVGLVTLIGLISKHGILIVEFANELQEEGKNKLDAIVTASMVRLRPILMTTAAMVLGVIPLITASGAGAISRFNIGLVIATGISIGTVFTLFVVPAMYMLLAEDRAKRSTLPEMEAAPL